MKIKKKLNSNFVIIDEEQRKRRTPLEKLAVWITTNVGTMGFFFILFGWTFAWPGRNTLASKVGAFRFLSCFCTMVVPAECDTDIFNATYYSGTKYSTELRAAYDFEINKKSELEVETILLHLQNQNKLMLEILHKFE